MKPKAKHPPKPSLLWYLNTRDKPETAPPPPDLWPIPISYSARLKKGRVEYRLGKKVVQRCGIDDFSSVTFDNVVYSSKDRWIKGFVGLMKGPKP